jgi:prepilin-type N-terminal cleavage/methylation domain-containing protein/prepilin-type processing-associated H-X9-DG protein
MDVPMKKNKAFTLLELLVVMSVIALLLVIVMPALARAKEQGRKVSCLNNLHQFYLAAMVYTQDSKGSFPIAYYSREDGSVEYCWDFTTRHSDEGTILEPGILWQGQATVEKIQQCPSFKGESNTASDPYTGYNYNTSYIGHGQNEMPPEPDRWNQMRRPAYCALFGDGEYNGGANKFMRSPLPSDSDWNFSSRQAGTQGFRHNQQTNVVFCDGAAVSKKDVFIEIASVKYKDILKRYNQENPKSPVGFLSADNAAYKPR